MLRPHGIGRRIHGRRANPRVRVDTRRPRARSTLRPRPVAIGHQRGDPAPKRSRFADPGVICGTCEHAHGMPAESTALSRLRESRSPDRRGPPIWIIPSRRGWKGQLNARRRKRRFGYLRQLLAGHVAKSARSRSAIASSWISLCRFSIATESPGAQGTSKGAPTSSSVPVAAI